MWIQKIIGMVLVAGLLTCGIVYAQETQDDDQTNIGGTPPRLSFMDGQVSFWRTGAPDWVEAEINTPLAPGDQLYTGESANLELQIDQRAFVRAGANTQIGLENLESNYTQFKVTAGSVSLDIRDIDSTQTVEVDAPNAALLISHPGYYRIDVEGEHTSFTVRRSGEATITPPDGDSFQILSDEEATLDGTGTPQISTYQAHEMDQWDQWGLSRTDELLNSTSARYVSAGMYGVSDLDEAGNWRQDSEYGNVWVPDHVASDWVPYREGHWAWVDPWGWTWVDDAPWGYAPFHYGRWAKFGASWGWIPGPLRVRPVYAPAMVAFVGGAGFGAAISIGGGAAVGWFPLGPREVWVPSYHVSAGYMTRVNVSNTVVNEVNVRNVYTNVYVNRTVVNNTYVNQRVPGAVVAVRGDAMVSGRAIGAAAIRVPPSAMARAEVVHAAPVAPERAAVLGGRAPVARGTYLPPAAAMNRQVVAKAAPPPAPVPFERQQEALRANPGRPLDAGATRNLQTNQPAPRANFRPASPNVPAARVPNATPGGRNMNGGRPPFSPPVNPPVNNAPRPNPEFRPEPAARPVPEPRREVRPESPAPRPSPEIRPAPAARPVPEPRREVRPAPPPRQEARPEPVAPRPAPRGGQPKPPEKKTEKPEKDK